MLITTYIQCYIVDTETHAELTALHNAQQSRVDLTKCSVYVTRPPCLQCTKVILQTGISIVIYGRKGQLTEEVKQVVYDKKACFK